MGEREELARHRASSGVCVPTQLSEIAPAKHLLKISSLFLLVPVWVDFTRKEGVSLALCLSTPLPEPFRVPGLFLFTKLAQCQPFWGPPGLPCPLLGLVHVHGGDGQPSRIVGPLDTGLSCCFKCPCGRVPSLGLTVTVKPLGTHFGSAQQDIEPTVQPPSGFCLCSTWGPLP